MPTTHHRKILPTHWQERRSWKKELELRQEDRALFTVGDFLVLQEWDPTLEYTGCNGYTGNEEVCQIDLVLRGHQGIEQGWAVLSTTTIHVHYRHHATHLLMDGRLCDDDEWATEPVDSVHLDVVLQIVKAHQASEAAAEQAQPTQVDETDPDRPIWPELAANVQEIQESGIATTELETLCAERDQAVKNAEELEALLEASDVEIRKLKRHRLILTAWMRMFRTALDRWSKDERGARINIPSIYSSWSTRPGHGARWVAEKMVRKVPHNDTTRAKKEEIQG